MTLCQSDFFILLTIREKQQWGNLLWGVKRIKRKNDSFKFWRAEAAPLECHFLRSQTPNNSICMRRAAVLLHSPDSALAHQHRKSIKRSRRKVIRGWNNEEAIRRTQNAARRRALRGTFSLDLESERWYIWVSIYANLSARTIRRKK